MSFDGLKTEEPKTPEGMTAIRMVVGYNEYGRPVSAMCDSNWEIDTPEKCECGYCDDDDDKDDERREATPIGQVQRIIFYIPSTAPKTKVAKAMDLGVLMAANQAPVEIQVVAPDAEAPRSNRDRDIGFGSTRY